MFQFDFVAFKKVMLKNLIDQLKKISNEAIFNDYITNKIKKVETFELFNIQLISSEDYIELFQQYVDLFCYQLEQQLPLKMIIQLIGKMKQSPTLHHNYLILLILESNFKRNYYTYIVHDIALAQKLIGLCVMLTNHKIQLITEQILKVIIPIIYRLPVYQRSFHKITEQYIGQQRYNESIYDDRHFFDFVQSNLGYFKKFHIEILMDFFFQLAFKKNESFKIMAPLDIHLYDLEKLKSFTLEFIQKINLNNNLFQKNEKYFKEIQNTLKSNDSFAVRICLQLLNQNEFNHKENALIPDQQVIQIFLNNQNRQSKYCNEIMKLLSKILLKFYRSQVQRILLNKKYQEILLQYFIKYSNCDSIIMPHLTLIEILFQENCIQAYNQYCPKILIIFIECLKSWDKKILLLIIGIIHNILNNVPQNRILANQKIFRNIINQIDKCKSKISRKQYSSELSIDNDFEIIILKTLELDIIKQIHAKTFFEKLFRI